MEFQGAIFDVDGVLVDSPHDRAWREALQELMEGDWRDIRDTTTHSPERFTTAVWQYEVTGGGRIWYLIDDTRRTAWITYAGTGHPKAAD
jgi:phosphoglycolate phosphatase-like HAD superfamily hydrolase